MIAAEIIAAPMRMAFGVVKQREFTVLGAFYHKGTQYLPKGILSEIEARKKSLGESKYQKRLKREPPRITDRA